MLKVNILRSVDEAAAYFSEEKAGEYYAENELEPIFWRGRGAEILGLSGRLEKEDMVQILDGYHPQTGAALVQSAGMQDRQGVGYDCTFSADKSVSIFLANLNENDRARAQASMRQASLNTIDYLSERAVRVRVKEKGVTKRLHCHPVVALAEHGTSRNVDPHTHFHAVMSRVGVFEDGKSYAIDARDLMKYTRAGGAYFRGQVTNLLGEEFGVQFERFAGDKLQKQLNKMPESEREKASKGDLCRIANMPERAAEVIDKSSTRKKEAVAYIEKYNLQREVEGKAPVEINQFSLNLAILATRKNKDFSFTREELYANWQQSFTEQGFGPAEQQKWLEGEQKAYEAQPAIDADKVRKAVLSEAYTRLTQESSFFYKHQLEHYVAEAMQDIESEGDFTKEFEQTMMLAYASDELVGFKGGKYSTRERFEIEQNVISLARESKDKQFDLDKSIVQKVRDSVPTLTSDQRELFDHFTQNDGAILIGRGAAGTGKTFVAEKVREAYENNGYICEAVGLSGKAASGIADAGYDSSTIAKYVLSKIESDKPHLKSGDKYMLLIEEAGMVDSISMNKILMYQKEQTEKGVDFRILQIGDSRQVSPISSGSIFRDQEDALGYAELKTVMRQKDPAQARAGLDIAEGKGDQFVDYLHQNERLFSSKTDEQNIDQATEWMAGRYDDNRHDKNWIGTIMGYTNAENDAINYAMRGKLIERDLLGEKSIKYQFDETTPELELRMGERLVFREFNDQNQEVNNGDFGRIIVIDNDERSIKMRLDNDHIRSISLDTLRSEIRYGYSATTYSMQGSTINESALLITSQSEQLMTKELLYPQATRHKDDIRAFVSHGFARDEINDAYDDPERESAMVTKSQCEDIVIEKFKKIAMREGSMDTTLNLELSIKQQLREITRREKLINNTTETQHDQHDKQNTSDRSGFRAADEREPGAISDDAESAGNRDSNGAERAAGAASRDYSDIIESAAEQWAEDSAGKFADAGDLAVDAEKHGKTETAEIRDNGPDLSSDSQRDDNERLNDNVPVDKLGLDSVRDQLLENGRDGYIRAENIESDAKIDGVFIESDEEADLNTLSFNEYYKAMHNKEPEFAETKSYEHDAHRQHQMSQLFDFSVLKEDRIEPTLSRDNIEPAEIVESTSTQNDAKNLEREDDRVKPKTVDEDEY